MIQSRVLSYSLCGSGLSNTATTGNLTVARVITFLLMLAQVCAGRCCAASADDGDGTRQLPGVYVCGCVAADKGVAHCYSGSEAVE